MAEETLGLNGSGNGTGVVEKAPVPPEALSRTVQQPPPGQGAFYQDVATGLFFVAQMADEMEQWGRNPKLRDRQLREFIPIEPVFNSALGIVMARNAAFSWKLEGPPRKTANMQRLLQQADFGAGWAAFMARVSVDLYTQDHGAFIEVIRAGKSETSEVVGIAHLDAQRCYPTGVPEEPVVYQDRNGAYHRMKWYQCIQLLEMPSTYEGMPGLQYSALTRMLRAVRIMRDVSIYLSEKIGGRNARTITAIKGVTPAQVDAAWETARVKADMAGLLRFGPPIIVGSTDPKADVGFATLDLASVPDGFSMEEMNKWYISQIAMAFLEDYQTFAPLPGGGLGTSTQSEVLHQKSRGKGPGLFQKIIAEAINWTVLPQDVEFQWDEQDAEADGQEAANALQRATERATRINSGELTVQVARMRAHSAGDLEQEELDALATQDLADEAEASEFEPEEDILEEGAPEQAQNPAVTGGEQQVEGGQQPQGGSLGATAGAVAQRAIRRKYSEDQERDEQGRFAGGDGGGGSSGGGGGRAAPLGRGEIEAKDVAAFTRGSKITTPLYHATTPKSADNIRQNGIDSLRGGGLQGKGFYASSKPGSQYAQGAKSEVLKLAVNVKNPLVVSSEEWKSGRVLPGFRPVRDELLDKGHDALVIKNVSKEDGDHVLLVKSSSVRVVREKAKAKADVAADHRAGPPKVAEARLDVEDDVAKVVEEAFVRARERLNRHVGK